MKKSPLVKTDKQRIADLEKTVKELMDWYVKNKKAANVLGEQFCQCEHPSPSYSGLTNMIQYCMICSRQIHVKPYTAMRSTGDDSYQPGDAIRTQMLKEAGYTLEEYKKCCVSVEEFIELVGIKPIKSQDDDRKAVIYQIISFLDNARVPVDIYSVEILAEKILAIVKGE